MARIQSIKPAKPEQGFDKLEKLITTRDAAQLLEVSEHTIRALWHAGKLPAITFNSRVVRYRLGDVLKFRQ